MVGRLRAYLAVVSAVGLVVLALLAASVYLGRVRDSLPEGAMLALVVLVAPFLSIPSAGTAAARASTWTRRSSSPWPWPPGLARPRW
jgi:hypothetical protein